MAQGPVALHREVLETAESGRAVAKLSPASTDRAGRSPQSSEFETSSSTSPDDSGKECGRNVTRNGAGGAVEHRVRATL